MIYLQKHEDLFMIVSMISILGDMFIYSHQVRIWQFVWNNCPTFWGRVNAVDVTWQSSVPLRWRDNGHDSVSNHQSHHRLFNRLFGCRSKKTSKLRVTGLYAGNSPGTGEFPAQMASSAENVSIWWCHHANSAWRLVYNLVQNNADVNAIDPEGLTPFSAALGASTEPCLQFSIGHGWWGGTQPRALMNYRLDDNSRDELMTDPEYVFPCLPSWRVTDKDCTVELMLRAGANPNILTEDRQGDCHRIWTNVFRRNNYPHPLVLALILANAMCCYVPRYQRPNNRIEGNISAYWNMPYSTAVFA